MLRIPFTVGLILLLASGCGPTPALVDEATVTQLASRIYPASAPLGPDMDVTLQQDRGTVRVTNREPASLPPGQLWLNQQYNADLPGLAVGPGTALALPEFYNRYREAYPVGGWLSPDRTVVLTSAEWYDPATGLRHRLHVWSRAGR